MPHPEVTIDGRRIGGDKPVYVVAELSANHQQDYGRAVELIHAAHEAGADAVKLQTFTADTITLDCDADCFRVDGGTLWDGATLHSLYAQAMTPWEWHPRLQAEAKELGLALFCSPFDSTAVEFLSSLGMPAYKVASFELVDIPLLKQMAATGKPVILSTGMASLAEICEAVDALREGGCRELLLLKCTSAYPAPPESMRLDRLSYLAETFGVPVGLSDHTLGITASVAAAALGACLIEKHFTLSRDDETPDAAFSLEPHELRELVNAVRTVRAAVSSSTEQEADPEAVLKRFRRSLFAVEDIPAGAAFTAQNVRSIRPGNGLHPRHLELVLQASATQSIARGTPLTWQHLLSSKA